MSTTDDHDRPAVPRPGAYERVALRDYFAAAAMSGLVHDILIEQHWEDVLLKNGLTVDEFPGYLAHLSYLTADAMLKERTRE